MDETLLVEYRVQAVFLCGSTKSSIPPLYRRDDTGTVPSEITCVDAVREPHFSDTQA